MAEQCAMIVGYLVPHRCPNKALATCIKCGRRFCDEHVAIVPERADVPGLPAGRGTAGARAAGGAGLHADDIAVFSSGGELDSRRRHIF